MNEHQVVLKLFNTETRQKEAIVPQSGHTIRMYTCGPTVYNFAHIGNFRAYVFEDLLRRTLKFFGMQVIQVMNLTDVEDKIIKNVVEKKTTLKKFTEPYIQAFFEDIRTLNIEPAEYYPKATDYIPEMIEIIQSLLQKGIAYQGTDKSVYFSIHRFPSYGRLSHLQLEELKPGASERLTTDEYEKENVCDFVLWKSYDEMRDGPVFWESPFGKGRPGWHIECSAMSMKILGETIDIHAGGVDNMFPHHENEIAQSEGSTGKQFVRYWVHCKHLLVDHRKMSKSLGNFYTLRDLLKKGYQGKEIRYMLLQAHYRMELNFTFQEMDAVVASLQRFSALIQRLHHIQETKDFGHVESIIKKTLEQFGNALADDLNTSAALASLFEMVREVNQLCDQEKIGQKEAKKILKFLHEIDAVLGVLPLQPEELPIPLELQEALEKRNQARAEKNWKEADRQRDFISSQGYLIEDTPQGARLKKMR